MKLNKTLTLAALVAASLLPASFTLHAQETPKATAPGRGHRLTPEDIAKKLELSDEVAAKFKTIWEDRNAQMLALRNDTTVADSEKPKKFREIMDASMAKLKEILTPDQMEKLKKLLPMGRNRAPMAPGGVAPATPPAAPAQN
jgi:Spy/CpxP family protein refolding chaperone